jgi:hypothetical protein
MRNTRNPIALLVYILFTVSSAQGVNKDAETHSRAPTVVLYLVAAEQLSERRPAAVDALVSTCWLLWQHETTCMPSLHCCALSLCL